MKLNVIIPCYNEAGNIELMYEKLTECLKDIKYELIFINDGSKDETENIIKELSKKANLDENMEIIYTSGSSESNNLAIKGIAKSYKEKGKHIISTFLEHSSVSSPLTYLKEQGYEIDIVNITNEGKVDLEHLKSLIRKDTILVSICYVDSEVGIVQPIEEIAKIVKEYPNCFFHVDCTQAIGKINIDLKNNKLQFEIEN